MPSHTRLRAEDQEESHVVFSQLAALIYPQNPIASPESFPNLVPSAIAHHFPAEEHLSCFDTMYDATSGVESDEWRFSWSPVWRTVGRHLLLQPKDEETGGRISLKGVWPAYSSGTIWPWPC